MRRPEKAHWRRTLRSPSRGWRGNIEHYKADLAYADDPRRGHYHRRGNLTDEGQTRFCELPSASCIDQVRLMREMLRSQELMLRVQQWCEHLEEAAGRLPARSRALLREALLTGVLREAIAGLQGRTQNERQSGWLLERLRSRSQENHAARDECRRRKRYGFPTGIVDWNDWIPRLYPRQQSTTISPRCHTRRLRWRINLGAAFGRFGFFGVVPLIAELMAAPTVPFSSCSRLSTRCT